MTAKSKPEFNDNYAKLREIALKLRSQEEPDIDALVPLVEEATKAYKECKSRIEGVKKALNEHLSTQNYDQ